MKVLVPATIKSLPRVAVVISGDEEQRHVGVLYRFGDKETSHLHLGFHHYLCDHKPELDGSNAWVGFNYLDEEEANIFATWLAKIWEKNSRRIPYGIMYWKGSHFSPSDGSYISSRLGCGLTCATFIIALFEAFGYDIVDIQTWPSRDSDSIFHEKIISALGNVKYVRSVDIDSEEHQAHIEAQKDNLGIAPRFRPEEVACAVGLYSGDPVGFDQAEMAGQALICDMRKLGVLK